MSYLLRMIYTQRGPRPMSLPALTPENRKAFNREFPKPTIAEIRKWINAK